MTFDSIPVTETRRTATGYVLLVVMMSDKYNCLPQHLEPLCLIIEILAACKATAPPYERPVKVRIKNLTPDVIFSEVIHRLDFAAGKHVCSSTRMKSELDVQVFYYYTSIS